MEVITFESSHPNEPYYVYTFNQGGGKSLTLDVSKYFVVTPQCPWVRFTLMNSNCATYSAITPRAVIRTVSTKPWLEIDTSTSQGKIQFCIKAETKKPRIRFKKFWLTVCGTETINSLLNSAALNRVYFGNSGVQEAFDSTSVFQSSQPDCPVIIFTVMQKINSVMVPFG